jgi:hypothetical protein
MLKIIGVILFAIGVFLLLPFDEVFILLPLILFYGFSIIPIYYAIAFFCFIVGALLLGIHIVPWLVKNPIGAVLLLIALMLALFLWVL